MLSKKGIILDRGIGSRFFPIRNALSKELIPNYDNFMINYRLLSLMVNVIRNILIIKDFKDRYNFQNLLGDWSQFGINSEHPNQLSPNGIVEAFMIKQNFLKNSLFTIILEENIFSIEEKLNHPKIKFVITIIYVFDNKVVEKAKNIKNSIKSELERTDIINKYSKKQNLSINFLKNSSAWFDRGNTDSQHAVSNSVRTLETKQRLKLGSSEEIDWENGWKDYKNFKKFLGHLRKVVMESIS